MYNTLPPPDESLHRVLARYLNRISRFTVPLYNACVYIHTYIHIYICVCVCVQTEFRWNNRKAKGYIDFSFHESFLYNHSAWIARYRILSGYFVNFVNLRVFISRPYYEHLYMYILWNAYFDWFESKTIPL